MNILTDTIVGLSTALSNSAVNIIRISGDKSLEIIKKIFTYKKDLNPNEIRYGFIKYEEEIFDEVLVSFMKSPKSYTGEDVIEINCHGGILITNKILNLVIRLGARLSEPGEFSKRAFLNGKIDLTKAESIIDLINAKSELELKCASSKNLNRLHSQLNLIKEKIINILTNIEVIIDFEDEIEDMYKVNIKKDIIEIKNDIEEILKYKDQGMLIKNGIKTCIVGKPNVGKSSLLNYLCNDNKAIVTNIAGTTRDVIEESVDIGGITLTLFDTAGIRESNDVVESIGIDMAKNKINDSDLILFLLDSTRDIENEDIEIYNLVKNKNTIFLLSKSEDNRKTNEQEIANKFNVKESKNIISISVMKCLGIDKLIETIKEKFLLTDLELKNDIVILTNTRHIEAFLNALTSLKDALVSIDNEIPLDIISIDVRKALKFIMNITGEDLSEAIVDNIFSKFCIGK